ncbi:ImmA/IrrE family metallo-endopeptidase [Rhodococcus ruber]|uniref:XRE family transcriptional regulator n=1 Tax=Rhodococcus ruber TaxID=1830 RepID=UPI00200D9C25|nr:XRE family transcriptional regulator [Rhodococcus ruber]UQB71220.1 ImmA/IrrE family metallo-endopeptidase [Rhodococcus ruber]
MRTSSAALRSIAQKIMMNETPRELLGSRLEALRDLKGLTQQELSEAAGVSQGFLSRVQNGTRALPEPLALDLCRVYSVPMSFFEVTEGVTDTGQFTFRKKAKASARDERRVKRLYSEAARLFNAISETSKFRTSALPDPAEFDGDPEECAEALRRSAGLGPEDPVKNVTRLLERHGIGVVSDLDETFHAVSDHVGVSRPNVGTDRPLVALTSQLPGAVQRLTLGHEAAHWIFDRDLKSPLGSTRSPEEARAFRFGGALLLPERVVRKRVTESLSLHGYLRIKADYGITVGAITRRAKDIGVISSSRYRSLSIQLSSQGWRTNEPVEVAQESPRLFRQALEQVYGRHYVSLASDEYGIEPALIQRWLGPEPQPNPGGSTDSSNVVSVAFGR